MTMRSLFAGRTPRINIESVGGDLSLLGWEAEDLQIRSDGECRISQDGDQIALMCDGELSLRVPRGAALTIQSVGGDLALRGVTGDVQVQSIGGDASMRDANNVRIGAVSADLSLRGARGNVSIGSINSDASLREIQGNVSLESVGDDLVIRDVRGSLKANVGGDVLVSLVPRSGNNYVVEAGDDVMLILPPETDADLDLDGESVIVAWPGVDPEDESSPRQLKLGRGGTRITIRAGSDIRVSSQDQAHQSPEEFGNFAGMMMDWSDFGTQLGASITRKVEAATKRAAQQAERAARRAEAKLNRPHLRGRGSAGRWNWDFDANAYKPPAPPSEPVSEDERMAILKMLAEKKITAAEADELLAALEGG